MGRIILDGTIASLDKPGNTEDNAIKFFAQYHWRSVSSFDRPPLLLPFGFLQLGILLKFAQQFSPCLALQVTLFHILKFFETQLFGSDCPEICARSLLQLG